MIERDKDRAVALLRQIVLGGDDYLTAALAEAKTLLTKRPRGRLRGQEVAARCAQVRAMKAANPKIRQREIAAALGIDRSLVAYYLGSKCKALAPGGRVAA